MKKKLVGGAFVATAAALSGLVLLPSAHADTAPVQIRSGDILTAWGDVEQGHVQFAADGLSVITDAQSSASKAQEFWDTAGMPLADAGEPTLNWQGTDTKPGINLIVDLDGDSSTSMYSGNGYKGGDAILVGEDTHKAADGTPLWWTPNSASLSNGSPDEPSVGSYSKGNGTLAEWRALYPNAKVVADGFSLGSGARGSGVITSQTLGATTYDFTATAADVPPPAVPSTAPANVQVAATTTNSVTLGWDDLPGAGTYTVYRDGVAVGTTHDTSFTVGGLHFNKAASFQVAAGQDWTDQVGPKSATVSGKTQTVTLAKPTHLVVVSYTATTVTLKVDAVVNAEGYRWYNSLQNAHFSAKGYSDGPTYTVTGLTKGTKYYFTVAADTTTTAPGPSAVSTSVTPK